MDSYTTGFAGKYESVRDSLTKRQFEIIVSKIANSDRFDFGERHHVVLRDTDIIVGYLGSMSAELCCPEDIDPNLFRVPHSHLRRIFKSVN